MSESQKKILEMLADKKIGVDEAYRLLSVLEPASAPESTPRAATAARTKPKYLRVKVATGPGRQHHDEDDEDEDDDAELINARVPLSLIRAGMKLTSLMPREAGEKVTEALREKGIDFDMRNIKPEDLDELIDALSELEVNVVSGKEVVKIFVE
ncbi:MAG: hypothetical protein E3J55_03560 [Dehalococcoidia bacterium]|nr:MAG: hypothetical protein E3J55_03560 [Dehalococcoidia bacterium]